MGFLDKLIAAVSPQAAYRREAFRQAYDDLKRNYDAGSYEKGNQNWRAMNQSADATDRYSRDNVRARARDLERNSDVMNSVVGAYKRNIVGGGYRLQAKTEDAVLNNKIERAWKKWCKKKNCDVSCTQSFNQIIRMAIIRKKVDGGILFVKRYTVDGFLPFKLQMIEVDDLDITATKPKQRGNKVAGGIEYTSYNKPVGYFIRAYDVDGLSLREPVYVEAENVIFLFSKRRPSQLREMSDMAPTIPRIRDINEFMVAVSVKERIAACLSVFIKRELPKSGIGRGITDGGRKNNYEGKTITPGMIKELNAGDAIDVVNPSGQSADATSFTKLQERLVGSGQGISYEATSRDMSESNYSSARQGLIEDELTFKDERELLFEALDEIYETFLISAVLAGKVKIPDCWERKDDYIEHEWIQEPKAWIDPLKESNANRIALTTGQKTYKQISAENGKDWKDQIDDMAEVMEYGKNKGIDMGGVMFGQQTIQQPKAVAADATGKAGK